MVAYLASVNEIHASHFRVTNSVRVKLSDVVNAGKDIRTNNSFDEGKMTRNKAINSNG
ncbi:hypothetical protein ATANTOWER_017181, partial [Ataeniobius toweri]|nr:hypothetical protein [Ataeniobius toweri]